MMPTTKPAHDIAEQADDEREAAGDLLHQIERDHDPGRLGKGFEIADKASGADAVGNCRDQHDQAERGIGFEMRRRRFDTRNERAPVGDQDVDQDRADKAAIRGRVGCRITSRICPSIVPAIISATA
jgi:hypothetical protein